MVICLVSVSQPTFEHPRGLLTKGEQTKVRQKVQTEPFKYMFNKLTESAKRMAQKEEKTISDSSALSRMYAYNYLLSEKKVDAELAWRYAEGVLNNPSIFNNPVSRGLNRATLLRNLAETYDLCYNGWPENRCREVSEKLFFATMTTASNMGYDANYSIESNWMGIRYGAVLQASIVNDDWTANENMPSRLLPFEWDAGKRVVDHMAANILSNGWNSESLSYFSYNWSFIAPALIAWQNRIGTSNVSLEKIAPKALNALWGYSTASVSIPGISGKLMQPDFSDDDPMGSYYLYPVGLRLFPEKQKPALLWMLNYLNGPDTWEKESEQLLYNILWTPENLDPVNPEKLGWLTYYDADQGLALFRNKFQDEKDIVAGFTATAKRVRGHQGFDNLGFRILGLGSIWAVGAGRTGQISGQSCLFPGEVISEATEGNKTMGKVVKTQFEADGSGRMTASGSCLNVTDHVRTFLVDYSKKSGAEAVFIVTDRSANGKIWRMNSPEFNKLTMDKDGFTLVAPNGARMKATVFTDATKPMVSSSKIHYGGDTKEHNSGISYQGKSYAFTNAIDCKTNGKITVVFTLQPKGKEDPSVRKQSADTITIGGINYRTKD